MTDLLRNVLRRSTRCLGSCATSPACVPENQPLESGRLPAPDVVVNIPGRGPCTGAPGRSVHPNSHQPVTVLVHGGKGSGPGAFARSRSCMPFAAGRR
jgi:hypothetical protein